MDKYLVALEEGGEQSPLKYSKHYIIMAESPEDAKERYDLMHKCTGPFGRTLARVVGDDRFWKTVRVGPIDEKKMMQIHSCDALRPIYEVRDVE